MNRIVSIRYLTPVLGPFSDEVEKISADLSAEEIKKKLLAAGTHKPIAKLIELGLYEIPHTRKLVFPHRTPEERRAVGNAVGENFVSFLAENPDVLAACAVPVPGAAPAYIAYKLIRNALRKKGKRLQDTKEKIAEALAAQPAATGTPQGDQQDPANQDLVPMRSPTAAFRVMQGGMGTSAIRTQLPIIQRRLAGRGMFYHGTDLTAAQGILQSPRGIDPMFAGRGSRNVEDTLAAAVGGNETAGQVLQGGKQARINRYLMGESLNRLLESHGVPLSHDQLVGTTDDVHRLMDQGVRSGDAAQIVAKKHLGELISSGKLSPEAAAGLEQKLMKELPNYGHRVYSGVHPADVAVWGTGKGEGGIAEGKLSASMGDGSKKNLGKAYGRSLANLLTGGWVDNAEDISHRLKYSPEIMPGTYSPEQVRARLGELGGGHQVVFGAEAPTAHMDYLKDFPVARRLLEIHPGLKSPVRQFAETYEPGRDISFPHELPLHNLKHVDVVGPGGRVQRFNLSSFQRAAKSPLSQRVKGLGVPLLMTGIGGYNAYRSIVPKKRMVPKTHPLAQLPKEKDLGKEAPAESPPQVAAPAPLPATSGIQKAATVASDIGQVAKYVLPAAGLGIGLGYGTSALKDRFFPEKPSPAPETMEESAKYHAKKQLHAIAPSLAVLPIGAGLGYLAGPRITGVPGKVGRILGAAGGGYLSQLFASPAAMAREQAKAPETDALYSMLPNKAQDWLREHPSVGGLRDAIAAPALMLGGAYTLRKYYPSAYAQAAKIIRDMASSFT